MAERSRWSVSWWHVGLALVAVFGLIALLEEWSRPFLTARSVARLEATVVPIPQPDSTVAEASASRVKRSGVSFEVPWVETDRSKHAGTSGMGLLLFENRVIVIVDRPPKKLESIRAMKGIEAVALRHELGSKVLSSEFALTSAALETRDSDVKWWRSPIYNDRVGYLLVIRSTITMGLAEGSQPVPIYSFSVGRIRGFQVGDSRGRQNAVKLVLFDEADRECGIELLNFQNVTQSEINTLIATLRFEK